MEITEKGKDKKEVWWKVKLREQEDRLKELEQKESGFNQGYADGFYECMAKYGIMSKVLRRRIRERLLREGPGAVKALKKTRFSMMIPSM